MVVVPVVAAIRLFVQILVWVTGFSNMVGEVFVVDDDVTLADVDVTVVADILIVELVVPGTKCLNVLFDVAGLIDLPVTGIRVVDIS